MRALIGLAVVGLILAGCANGYQRFYVSTLGPTLVAQPLPPTSPPRIMSSSGNSLADVQELWAEGYMQIGYASFSGAITPDNDPVVQAKKVGAAIVVVSQRYASTISGVTPIVTTTPVTTTESGTANAYGSGGMAFGSYSGTSTTYVTDTAYMPYSVNIYNQTAIFFARGTKAGTGLLFMALTPQMVSRLGTNRGVLVTAVRRGSPGFFADIVPGDVIQSVDGQVVYDGDTMVQAGKAGWGHAATYQLLRHGKPYAVMVSINADGSWP